MAQGILVVKNRKGCVITSTGQTKSKLQALKRGIRLKIGGSIVQQSHRTSVYFCSRMLIVIVVLFLICSLPRFILNLVELVLALSWYFNKNLGGQSNSMNISCLEMPAWTFVMSHVSSLLMTINASSGFLIYCMACQTFLEELKSQLRKLSQFCLSLCRS